MTRRLEEDYRDASDTITICMHCGRAQRISPERTRWDLVSEFLANPPRGASHGLCPDCLERHYPPKQPDAP